MPTDIRSALDRFFKAHPLSPGAPVLTAVSGGADSMALLHGLVDLLAGTPVPLVAAHLHHGMRMEADSDVEMLHRACRELGVPLEVGRADVPALARRAGVSLEVAGRDARYAFLYDTAVGLKAQAVCTGHTKDDQAETVLLRVVAGTGIEGLGGIAPARRAMPPETRSAVWLYRPLLDVTRRETAAFCAERGLSVVTDPANADPRYPRNRVRSVLLPLLEREFNPAVRDALSRLADLAREDESVLSAITAGEAEFQRSPGGGVKAHREPLMALPLAVQRRLARTLLREAGAEGRALGFENVERFLHSVEIGARECHLDGGLSVRCDTEHVFLAPIRASATPISFEEPVLLPGETVLPSCVLVAAWEEGSRVDREPFAASLDADRLDGPLIVRNRRPGDRMRPLGMAGSRKVGDLLTDLKVDRWVRDRLPVVTCGEQIAWVAGVAVSENYRVSEETRRTLQLRVSPPLFATKEAGGHTRLVAEL